MQITGGMAMHKKMSHELNHKLTSYLTDKDLLSKISILKKTMLELLQSQSWKDYLQHVIDGNPVGCEAVLTLCRPILKTMSKEPTEGWLSYIYQSILSEMFPNTVIFNSSIQFDKGRLFYLEVLRSLLREEQDYMRFHPQFHFDFLKDSEIVESELKEEYCRLMQLIDTSYIYEFMRIGTETTRYKTLAHIAGVHHIGMHVGRQLKLLHIPIELALVSGASFGHDLGKYGCKPEESKRIPYLHYYYTDWYFRQNHLPTIGRIATNHSTWDLELENLSVESLVLIYADFRVKNKKDENGKDFVHYYTLDEAFDIILSKLDNVDEAKRNRYAKVYAKLKDFEDYMDNLGVELDLSNQDVIAKEKRDAALFQPEEVVKHLKYLAIQHNIFVMHKMNDDTSFCNLLEAARSETNWKNMRAYLNIMQEYFSYMTQKQKTLTLQFLYELLMHREGDIRRQSATLMGNILIHYDEEYRKELPEGVTREINEVSAIDLWELYLGLMIYPDHKVTEQHRRWIGYTLKLLVSSVLERCKLEECQKFLKCFLDQYHREFYSDSTAFVLLDSIMSLPFHVCDDQDKKLLGRFALQMMKRNSIEVKVAALRFISHMASEEPRLQEIVPEVGRLICDIDSEQGISVVFLKYQIQKKLHIVLENQKNTEKYLFQDPDVISELFLENLKVATPWIVKSVNIDILLCQVKNGFRGQVLQVATHLSNLIKVSERVAVRHSAGKALLSILPLLMMDQKNEIAVELCKGLEIGEYEFSKYIPEYLGELAMYLHPNELDELILDLEKMLNSNNDKVCSVTLDTLGIMVQNYPDYQNRFYESTSIVCRRREQLLGLILKGLSHYHQAVSQEAFLVIGQYIFGTNKLSLEDKKNIFTIIYKRMLMLSMDQKEDQLAFFNNAAAQNHVYRFISDYLFYYHRFDFPELKPIAFFPGSFDPFSTGHKGILKEIKNLGFEVYLAMDEFFWSRRTQPKLIRRKIIQMSIADEKDVFLFPDEMQINIGNPADLKCLKSIFSEREVYIVVGSDVIDNASSYLDSPQKDSVHGFPHIIFQRFEYDSEGKRIAKKDKYEKLTGKTIELSLPAELEEITSERIRENLDKNRDISNLIDPVVQNYIYDNSLYLREPQFKPIMGPKQIHFEMISNFYSEIAREIASTFFKGNDNKEGLRAYLMKKDTKAILIRDGKRMNKPAAICIFHEINMADLYHEFMDVTVTSRIRRMTSGKLIVISGIDMASESSVDNLLQLAFTEAMAYCLSNDYTYALYHNPFETLSEERIGFLKRQGFVELMKINHGEPLYAVDMKFPVALFRDILTTVKEPFHENKRILNEIDFCHKKMQQAVSNLYPGSLVLSIDSNLMNQRIVNKITNMNRVSSEPSTVRKLGESMCVPFGKILRGMAVPNTVTKSLHTEKKYDSEVNHFQITELPYYAPLINQIRTIKSFCMPVLLIDDLIHNGYRMQKLDPIFRQENLEIKKTVVGVLSGRGKDLMSIQGRETDWVYFIPNLRTWFDESSFYPFVGGDGVSRDDHDNAGLIPSINLILPYVAPRFLMDVPKHALYDFSLTCLENAKTILLALEEEYQIIYERNLTMHRLSEALVSPRYPDKGMNMKYDLNLPPSSYMANDIESLKRLKNFVIEPLAL